MLSETKSASGGKKINFVFGVHNHQPVGNFDNVFESAAKMAYGPFLDVIEKHPKVKVLMHYTGCLLDWLEKNRPEMLERIKALVKAGRAEILTGGYYEPIMPAIPDAGKTGQIKKLTDYVKKTFSYNPKGIWLAERVWEPSLAKVLKEAGVEYIVLDDAHFLASGIDEKKLRGYFITEEQGTTLKVFPINQHLRYIIPFAQPEKTIEFLKSESSAGSSPLLIMADDGEKFGIWPDTYNTCYEEKWLEKFLVLLEENSGWINMTTPSEYMKNFPACDLIYLPTASYFEMGVWSLPAKAQVDFAEITKHCDDNLKRFLKGGFWRNFLTKYSESNNMHKKMLYVSEKIQRISGLADKQVRNNKNAPLNRSTAQPLNCLYKAQCNCAYWHGVFGGLYLPHLRHAIYKNLIEAENILESGAVSRQPEVEVVDFDKDGQDEIILSNKNINVYAKPSYGGAITEIDFKPVCYNLTDVLTRRFESYHKNVKDAVIKTKDDNKEPFHGVFYTRELGLQKYLKYDWHNRYSLLDHFFHSDTTIDKLSDSEYGEVGDFVNQPYDFALQADSRSNSAKEQGVTLRRSGNLWLSAGVVPAEVSKKISIAESGAGIRYGITNGSGKETEFWYGCEFNLSFSSPDDERCFYAAGARKEKLSAKTVFEKLKSFSINDSYGNFNLEFNVSDNFDFWVFPIWTVSMSDAGFEKTYQGSAVVINKKFRLAPKETFGFNLAISVKKI